MPLILSLLRHAKSDWGDPDASDFERTLAPRGRQAAPMMGAALREIGLRPDLVLCSSATRTRETLALVLAALDGPPPPVLYEEELYLASAATILERLTRIADRPRHVLVVGHNPGLHALASILAHAGSVEVRADLDEKFPTAGLAILELDADRWRDVGRAGGTLLHFLTPRGLAAAGGR